jgi:RNA polymerase sigma factor (sigma-70 family)
VTLPMEPGLDLDTLLPAIASGDANAFGRFIAGCELDVRRALRPFAVSVDVEAVVQEAFLRAWQFAPRVTPDGRGNSLVRFVMRAARNLAISEVRRKKEELPGDLRPEDAPVDADVTDPLLRQLIADCFEKLPNQPSVAIRMRLESAGSNPDLELAEKCGMRLNTFLQNVTRARKLLAECLERRGVVVPGAS